MRKSGAPPGPRTKTTGKTYTYTYDNVGNITSKSDGTSTIAYTYGTDSDAGWSKLLTSYNGESIDYDAIGNPVSYRGANLTWTGRQLNSYSKDGTSITYKYDADGLRGSKTVNGTKTTYQYIDGKLYYQETNGNDTYFYYDSYGNITSFAYYPENGTSGYVLVGTNSLGDVNALYNANGDLLVKYEYDAWGKVIAETDANGNALTGSAKTWSDRNPFRYRGYVYDAETGLYYLQSRYYDPEVGRFLNSDAIVNTTENLGFNTYAYCGNNPVNCVDHTGYLANYINDLKEFAKETLTTGYDYVCQAESYGAYKKIAARLTRPKENGGTFSFDFTGGYTSGGITGGKSYALSVDNSYNYALQKTESTGVSTGFGASGGIAISFTDAANVNDLDGKSLSRGVTLVSIFGISIDYIEFNPASNPDKTYRGINVVISAGSELDLHAMENYTITTKQWNPFNHF